MTDGPLSGLNQEQVLEMRAYYDKLVGSGVSHEEAIQKSADFAMQRGWAKMDRPTPPQPPQPIGPSMNDRMNGNVRTPAIPPVAGAIQPNNLTQRMSGQVPMPAPAPRQPGSPAPTLPNSQSVGPSPTLANGFNAQGPRVRNISNTAQPASLMSSFAAQTPQKSFPGSAFFPPKPEGPEDRGDVTSYGRRHMRRSPQLARALMQNRPGLY